ncbi:MAG: AmmeMemoRadiSam system protein B [bacterium]
MSVIFSAIASHSPLLIPEVGKENTNQLKQTLTAYDKLRVALESVKPETIIILSPHGLIQPEAFSLNISSEFEGKFEEFGDLTNKFKLSGDVELAARLKENLESKTQLQIINEPVLDSGSAVPLFLLTKNLPNVKIIPIYNSQQDLKSHYEFGQLLRHELVISQRKIAIIVSADLSCCLSRQALAGYSLQAKKFDKKVIKAIENDDINILKIDPKLIKDVNETGLRPIMILLGLLSDMKKTAKLLSYEHPFGVGCLVVNYSF